MPTIHRADAPLRRRERGMRDAPVPSPDGSARARSFWRAHGPIVLVAAVGLALRLRGLTGRFINFDESVLLDPDALRMGLLPFANKLWSETTYNPGWPMLVWVVSRIFGPSTFWARLPSALCGALAPVALYAAARGAGLSRRSSVLAALVMAVTIVQVEYGQQIMPHGALPLGCCLCLWLVTRLANWQWEDGSDPWRLLVPAAGLVTVFGLLVFLHSSALLLIPLLLGYWAWGLLWPPTTTAGPVAPGRRRLSVCVLAFCTIALAFASLGWFVAKAGASDWWHLRPFFLATFRNAPERGIVSDSLEKLDAWYFTGSATGRDARPLSVRDVAYFSASRVFDFFHGQFKLRPEQQFSIDRYQWLLPMVMILLAARGIRRSFVGGTKTAATRWVVCAAATLALIVGFSAFRLFPIGGIRHLIVLSPLAVLMIAVGLESRSRWRALGLTVACLAWVAGDFVALPAYYRTTHDRLSPAQFQRLAARFGVRDFVAADTICTEGALRLKVAGRPGLRMVPSDHADFARITLEHRPFLLCALGGPIFDPPANGQPPAPTLRVKQLSHPMANLHNYRAVRLGEPTWTGWLCWDVFSMEPKPGPYAPEVAEVVENKRPGEHLPWSYTVRFSKPIRPETLNADSVQLVARDAPAGVPRVGLDLHYSVSTQTLFVVPIGPMTDTVHLLKLDRAIEDRDGRPLDAAPAGFFQQISNAPGPGPGPTDRGWLIRIATGAMNTKM